jgi:propanediol utilization protein
MQRLVESVVKDVLTSMVPTEVGRTVPVGVSARHLHITQENLEFLFGAGSRLTKLRDLNQPGEFAANETVTVVGPNRRTFERVRILGPVRSITQVELSYTDGVYLGLDLPHRLSGNIEGSAPLILIGPKGVLHLTHGGIRAARHIHINPEDALRLGLENGQKVSVKTIGPMSVTFNNVIVRRGENLNLEMHIDTDEANAAGLRSGDRVELLD